MFVLLGRWGILPSTKQKDQAEALVGWEGGSPSSSLCSEAPKAEVGFLAGGALKEFAEVLCTHTLAISLFHYNRPQQGSPVDPTASCL